MSYARNQNMFDVQARLREGESETARAIRNSAERSPVIDKGDGGYQLTRDFLLWLGLRVALVMAIGSLAYRLHA